ncbi:hypothetical protein QS197_25205, partial [Escherichia coli]|nr:hypothetical protein [Escherichia coli]MDL6116036.1 hypothetical protein [Escherichia coli]MDL6120802.1 hypothetical protein [Escherichia coli]MDL6215815.1 hypothetical protein [Escherichia coli]MDL6225306.1 hypothetical protein [Escherichia coli]
GLSGELSGNASTAAKLKTARKISNVAFDGSSDITLKASHVGAFALGKTGSTVANDSKRKLTAVCSHQTRIGNLDAHLI